MSAPRRIPDSERTATMLDLIRRRYEGDRFSHVVVEEVAPGTGWSAVSRWADVLVLSVWPSNGLTLDGFEIKASRADLKKELSDPSKAEALARYCDTWTLVAWDDAVLVDGIPEAWGIITTIDGDHGRELTVKQKATKRVPDPWPRAFVCSLVRNAHQQAPGAAYVARACDEAGKLGRKLGESIAKDATRHALEPLRRALFGRDTWKWPKEAHDVDATLRIAAERVTQGALSIGDV